MQQELWRVHRVARVLDITQKRVYQMVGEGKLDAVRMGERTLRITRASVERFIEQGTERAAQVKNVRRRKGF